MSVLDEPPEEGDYFVEVCPKCERKFYTVGRIPVGQWIACGGCHWWVFMTREGLKWRRVQK